jgi:hypothetical protein
MLRIERLESQTIQSFGNNKTKGPKQDSQNRLRSPTSEGREHYLGTENISNRPCQCRNTDYWADDNLMY